MPSKTDTPSNEQWIKLRLPVRVWGMDSGGQAFQLRTETVEVKRTAAQLNAVPGLKAGDVVGLQFEESKSRFKVTQAGSAASPDSVVIESLVPDVCLWEQALGSHSATASASGWEQPALSSITARSVEEKTSPPSSGRQDAGKLPTTFVMLPQPERRTNRGGDVEAERRNRGRRHAERFACAGTAEVTSERNKFPLWATISDLSSEGCYIETRTPLQLGSHLEVALKVGGVGFRAKGKVCTMHPMVGMGVEFLSMPAPEDQQELSRLLAQMAESTATPDKPAAGQEPAAVGQSERDTLALLQVPLLLAQIGKMEELLKASTVQGRILNDFHEALFHTQRTLGNIQRFFELSAKNQDPYSVLSSVHEERVRVATELLNYVAMDMDSLEIDAKTKGLHSFREAVQGVLQRFTGLGTEPTDSSKR